MTLVCVCLCDRERESECQSWLKRKEFGETFRPLQRVRKPTKILLLERSLGTLLRQL